MEHQIQAMIPLIESIYESFTPLEKTIADFFMKEKEENDFSAKNISKKLYVSEASLSRFAKKCGFSGYREFLFHYQQEKETKKVFPVHDYHSTQVLDTYQELLNKTYHLMNEEQMERIVKLLSTKSRIYVYGKGSSGLVAQEMKLRFMRLGVNIEAITDEHIMKMNAVLLDKNCLVIGISVSGTNEEVLNSLQMAKAQDSSTILMSARRDKSFRFCDEVLVVASKKYLENGMAISPQFPVLVMVDIVYSRFLESDKFHKEALHDLTLNALHEKKRTFEYE